GIPEDDGLRCPYHGWKYAADGQCLETPLEPDGSKLASQVRLNAYPVQELGGLVFAYLGPEPVPLLPRWEQFVREDAFRQIIGTIVPCNWLQCMENRLDTMHGIFLHGNFFQYIWERKGGGTADDGGRLDRSTRRAVASAERPHADKLVFERYEHGIEKHVQMPGRLDHRPPVVFPYSIESGSSPDTIRRVWQIGVPLDDTHTWHISYYAYTPGHGVEIPKQDTVPFAAVPLMGENGKPILDYVLAQDMVAWWSQGDITDRSRERLGWTDQGIALYRRMLKEQIDIVQEGGDPINVFRDPAHNVCVKLPSYPGNKSRDAAYRNLYHEGYIVDDVDRYAPDKDIIIDLMRQASEAQAAGH
ncbi:MAG: rieske 2Fe-2S iron-sulfur domain protein, partial [Chloroflexi bacterium]|nr:rieske 2Fe-2S iron-sulfur domain protein [Chloroflexota bacterium]